MNPTNNLLKAILYSWTLKALKNKHSFPRYKKFKEKCLSVLCQISPLETLLKLTLLCFPIKKIYIYLVCKRSFEGEYHKFKKFSSLARYIISSIMDAPFVILRSIYMKSLCNYVSIKNVRILASMTFKSIILMNRKT